MHEAFTFGRFRLLRAARLLYEGDQRLKLGGRAVEILLALVERSGDLVSKQDLVARVWPGLHVDDGALRVHVSALRKVLGDDPAAPQYIFNVAGQGYRFVAPTAPTTQEESTPDGIPAADPRLTARAIGRFVR
jgi:DNA-binding winged helix-turn-helix (wHTH) protein